MTSAASSMAPKTRRGKKTRREVAVIKDGVDAGGSYVFVQRWEHNLKQLNRMSRAGSGDDDRPY
ncbi:iron-dependent peroxidase [Klebsiella pneumoniae]|uniref:Iron-dependent peroxidase n=1 Tax=Klebsiella pneumoniae TaxID=573 RepID=A0A2X1SHQ7_KLEPN|nr:iron-dependent peroxidase [Klebsiella pneumoniae]